MNQFTNGAFNFIDQTAVLGAGTTCWHYCVVLADVVIGENCSIGSHAEIGHGTRIGNNTRIGKGVFLPPNSIVGNNVFIAPGVFCADDKHPCSGNLSYVAQPPIIEDHAVIGMCAVLLPGVRIGKLAFIGAGSVVTKDVAPGTKVYGDAAKLRELGFKHLSREYGWIGGA